MSSDVKTLIHELRSQRENYGGDLIIGCLGIPGVTPEGGVAGGSASLRAMLRGLSAASSPLTNPMTTLGDVIYGGTGGTATRLAGNTASTRKFLRSMGAAGLATAPDWDSLLAGDIPDLSSTYQPLDGDLTAIAALTGTGYARRTGTSAWTIDNLSGTGTRLTTSTAGGVLGNATTIAGDYVFTGTISAANLTLSGGITTNLTAGRVPVVTTAGLLTSYADLTFTDQSGSGTDSTFTIANSQNNSGADAVLSIQVGGATAGDPSLIYSIPSGTSWTTGVRNSDGDAYEICEGSALGTNVSLKIAPGTAATGLVQVLRGDFIVQRSDNGGSVTGTIQNTSNSSTTSYAKINLQVGGTSAGDPFISYVIPGGASWSSGIRNQGADAYQIGESATLGSNVDFQIQVGGNTSVLRGDFDITRSASGGTVTNSTRNTSNTASSQAKHLIQVAGTTADDPFSIWQINGGNSASIGLDNSVSGDPLTASYATTLGTSNIWAGTASSFTVTPAVTLTNLSGSSVRLVTADASGLLSSTTAAAFKLPVTLDVQYATAGNVGVGEDDLMSFSVPGATLGTDKDSITIICAGQFASSLSNKRIRAYFGSDLLFDTGALAITAAADWALEITLIRTGATTQRAITMFTSSSATLAGFAQYSTPARTLSSANTIKLTGEATNDNDVTQTLEKIVWESAP